jgi:signal transduction histidine kinase/ligand-binding sensor domain-containing protein
MIRKRNQCKRIEGLMYRLLAMMIAVISITGGISIAQQSSYKFKNYSVVDGLPENSGTSLLQTRDGYLWIGTQGGLARTDGYDLISFIPDLDDSTSISDASIFSLFQDRVGSFWVGTSNGLNLFDPWSLTFKRYIHDPSNSVSAFVSTIKDDSKGNIWTIRVMPDNTLELWRINISLNEQERFVHDAVKNNSISAPSVYLSRDSETPLYVDLADNVWLGTLGGGLNRFDSATGGFIHYRHDPANPLSIATNNVYALYESKNEPGIIWVTTLNPQTGNGNLQRLDVKTGNFQTVSELGRSNYLSFSFFDDNKGNLWIGDNLALHKYNIEDKNVQTYRVPSEIANGLPAVFWDISPDYNGLLWLRTEYSSQMMTFDPNQGIFRKVNMATDRPEGVVTFDMISDHAGLIWFGSWGSGVYSLDPAQSLFQHVQLRDTQSERYNRVLSFYEDKVGKVWIGTHLDGLTMYDTKTGIWQAVNIPGLRRITITTVRGAGDGRAWVASRDVSGLSRIDLVDLESYRLIPLPVDFSAKVTNIAGIVREIYTDSDGTTWIAIDGGGIVRLKTDGSSDRFIYDEGNPDRYPDTDNRPFSFYEDASGMWVSTNLYMLKYDKSSDAFKIVSGNWSSITRIIPAKGSSFWAGSYLNGLIKYDVPTSTQRFFGDEQGLAHTSIFDMARDNSGNVWLSTGRGLSYFPEDSVRFTNFGPSSGIRPGARGSIMMLRDGTMITSGADGFYMFNPSSIRPNPVPPKIVLAGLRVFNKNLWPGEPDIELPRYSGDVLLFRHNQNMVSIDFTGLFFSNSDEIYYSHKLQGFDDSWSIPSNYRSTTFTNLAPGTYQLMVRASNPDKVWSEETMVVSFQILKPWWQTWWAYGFYIVILGVAVFFVDRYQRKRLIKQEEERNRERELEHAREIEKAYNNLEIAHQNLKSAQKQLIEQEKLASLGQLTAGIAHEIKNPLNFVNNFSAVSIEMVDEVVVDLEKYMEDSPDRDFIKETLNFIKANLTKINEHGTRADGIVKSMLMHSRGGSGKMEPTNLNDLIKEYVNLAFHGMRAGKNAISVDLDLKLDESIGDIPMIAEDFSRVILNLTNNAFDAMRDKLAKNGEGYKPALKVTTHKEDKLFVIEVADNGPGIPDNIRDKILQPFFTTKKGTEGTGLGLSITHDIVKAHGGFIEIDSTDAGATFRVVIKPEV